MWRCLEEKEMIRNASEREKRLHEAGVQRANSLLRMWNESREAERLWHQVAEGPTKFDQFCAFADIIWRYAQFYYDPSMPP